MYTKGSAIDSADEKLGGGVTFEVHRRLHVHKGQRHELRDASCVGLQVPQRSDVACPGGCAVQMPKHDG